MSNIIPFSRPSQLEVIGTSYNEHHDCIIDVRELRFVPPTRQCPACGGNNVRIKGELRTLYQDWSLYEHQFVFLRLHRKIFLCNDCKKSFNEPLPDAFSEHHKVTKRLEDKILLERCTLPITDITRKYDMTWDTVDSIIDVAFQRFIDNHDWNNFDKPLILGTDEKSYTAGHNYIYIVYSYTDQRVIWSTQHNDKHCAELLLERLGTNAKHNVLLISGDAMPNWYKTLKESLPYTIFTMDTFHVVDSLVDDLGKIIAKCKRDLIKIDKDNQTNEHSYAIELLRKSYIKRILKRDFRDLNEQELNTLNVVLSFHSDLYPAWNYVREVRDIITGPYYTGAETDLSNMIEHSTEVNPIFKTSKKYILPLVNRIMNTMSTGISNATLEAYNASIEVIIREARGYDNSLHNLQRDIIIRCSPMESILIYELYGPDAWKRHYKLRL